MPSRIDDETSPISEPETRGSADKLPSSRSDGCGELSANNCCDCFAAFAILNCLHPNHRPSKVNGRPRTPTTLPMISFLLFPLLDCDVPVGLEEAIAVGVALTETMYWFVLVARALSVLLRDADEKCEAADSTHLARLE